ncbi:MAG TPA: AMP-binding protein [Gammaproteobacteria bacterium]|nr:AMP-binding protein [Gammaproteobacteria bacterium]
MTYVSFPHFAERDAEAVAVIDPDGVRWSRARLARLASRISRALCAAGLEPEDAAAIVAPNCAEYLAVYFAAIDAGLRVVPVNWHLAEEELAFVLADSETKAVFVHARLGAARLASVRRAAARCEVAVSIGAAHGFTPLEDFVAAAEPRPLAPRPAGRVMPYTSATTGRPKGVLLPTRNAAAALERIVAWHTSLGIEVEAGNVHLCASMLYHSAPLEGAVTALHMGHAVVLVHRFHPEDVLALIERHAVTTSFMVPAMFVRLVKLPARVRRRYSTGSLRFVVHGGAPCPIEIKKRMLEWWGPIVWESYGAAEAQGVIVSPSDWLEAPGTVGKPISGSGIKILDERGRELRPGEIGLVYLKPHTGDRFEYKGDPEKTRDAYRGDFITVGDLGYVDEQGRLFICDRRADLIVSSGMNIYPAEIEQALLEHPAVEDCAVCGVHHDLFGQVPKAFVKVAIGAAPGPALTAALLDFLARRIAAMKLPRRIEYRQEIPRDPTGKLYRRRLREEDEHGDASAAERES